MGNFQKYWSQNVGQDFIVLYFYVEGRSCGRKRCVRDINVSRAWDPVHAGDKALTRETPAKRGRVNRQLSWVCKCATRNVFTMCRKKNYPSGCEAMFVKKILSTHVMPLRARWRSHITMSPNPDVFCSGTWEHLKT